MQRISSCLLPFFGLYIYLFKITPLKKQLHSIHVGGQVLVRDSGVPVRPPDMDASNQIGVCGYTKRNPSKIYKKITLFLYHLFPLSARAERLQAWLLCSQRGF